MVEVRNTYSILIGKPGEKRPRGKPGCRWEDNIRMDLREIIWEVVDWKHVTYDMDQWRALVTVVINLRVP
jgi:hypothetical protein